MLKRLLSRIRSRLPFAVIPLFLTSSFLFIGNTVFASGGPTVRFGTIAAKGVVLGEHGKPIWTEFNEKGEVVREIGEAYGDPLGNANLMAAAAYRAYVATYEVVEATHRPNYDIMYREAYENYKFTAPDGTVISQPPLKGNTLTVLVAKPAFDSLGLVLHESPLDLNRLEQLPEDVGAVLLSKEGRVLETGLINIGYLTAYYTPQEATGNVADYEGRYYLRGYQTGDKLWGPIAGAKMTAFDGRFPSYSDENGQWAVHYIIPPCPGFSFQYQHHVMAELRYHTFDPQQIRPGVYYEYMPAFDACMGFSELISPLTLVGAITKLNLLGIESSGPQPMYRYDFSVDVAMLTGEGILHNERRPGVAIGGGLEGRVLQGPTRYDYSQPIFNPLARSNFDLDADGEPDDTAILPDGTVGVWLGDSDPATDEPDLIRQADYELDISDQGLLKQISPEDLKNTDIYLYRVSNGQLISYRRGLMPGGVSNESDSLINYRTLMKGPAFSAANPQARWEWFQAQTNVNPELRGYQADHVRVGEQIKVIAINRATGYIGSGIGTYGQNIESGIISFSAGRIVMRPPNLKIKAERRYEVQHGLTADEEREYIIGFEGSGLTSDQYVMITTEWTDWYGRPLPDDLPGYTGRLAKVVAKDTLGQASSQIANFDIPPGLHTQLVQLPTPILDTAHYYIHVSGESPQGNPDFSATDAGPGLLKYRPKHYVPIQVPVYDESATLDRKLSRNRAINDDQPDPGEVPPAYRWVYRPEMQFSLFDLEVKKIEREDLDGNIIDILESNLPVISSFDQQVDFIYTLLEDELPVLAPFGPDRELIFAIGEEEFRAVIGEDQKVEFSNIENLALLDAEDFLSIRLYQNGDDENLLWQLAYIDFEIDPNEEAEVSADDASVYIVASAFMGKNPVEDGSIVEWYIEEGAGTLSERRSMTEDGLAIVTLNTTTNPGDIYKIRAKLKTAVINGEVYEVDDISEVTHTIRVVPGKAANILISRNKDFYAADETDKIELTAEVRDQFGNYVADGTPVSWILDGLGGLQEEAIVEETTDGIAIATIKSGFLAEDQTIFVQADGYEHIEVIEVTPVDINLTASKSSLDIYNRETAVLTATFKDGYGNDIADGTEITWFTSNGKIDGDLIVTNGTASALLVSSQGRIDRTLVSVAAGNFVKSIRIPFISSAPTTMEIEHPVIVGDAIEDGTIGIEQYDGSVDQVPFHAKTKVDINGSPGATAKLWLSTLLPVSSYSFENLVGNEVEDNIGTNNAIVNGAFFDPLYHANGFASLAFDGDGNVTIPDEESLHIENGLAVSAWVRPASYEDSIIFRKEGEYSLSLSNEGKVSFSIITADGIVTVTSIPHILLGNWNWIKGTFDAGQVSISVNGLTTTNSIIGDVAPGGHPIVIGESFRGNIDDLIIYKRQQGAGGLLQIAGIDQNGEIVLDETGQASIYLESTGILTSESFGEELDVHIIASPEEETQTKVVSKKWYTYVYNFGKGFIWGDADGIEGTAGDFAAGMTFGIGDARDIVKNLGRLWPGGEDPDWVHFGFALVGLATEFVPLAGEAPDAIVTAVKVMLPKIGKGIFRTGIIRVTKRMFQIAWRLGPSEGIKYADEFVGLFKALVFKGDEAISAFNTFIKSEKALGRAAKLQKLLGDDIVDVLVNITKRTDLGPEVAEKVALTLGKGIDDTILQGLKNSGKFDEAIEGLAKALKNRIDPGELRKAISNNNLYTSAYKDADLLVDMGEVAGVKGLDSLVKSLKQSGPQALGRRYELEAAAWLKRSNFDVVEFSKRINPTAGLTDIDIVIKEAGNFTHLQAKRSTAALRSLPDVKKWVKKAMQDLGTNDFKRIKYVLPPDTRIPRKIADWFDLKGISIIDVPHL